MKKRISKIISMVLCVSLILGIVACSNPTTPTNGTNGSTAAPSGTNATTPAQSSSQGGTEEVQTEPVIFVVRSNSDYENKTSNDAIYQMIKEQSGIDFELQIIPQDSWAEKVNLMITGGDNWDVLNITESAGNWSQYYQKNALQPWDEYLQYMPNVANRLNDESLKGCTLSDGSIYALPRKEYFSKQFVPAIRQDWLDAMGMKCPTTMAELEAYFQGVIDNNLNGSDNEIPMMTFLFMENQNLRPFYLGFYGDHYLTADGEIYPWYMHENSYLLLEELQKWYKNGWLYSEYQTMAIQDGFDLISADRVGGWTGPYNAGVGSSTVILENNPDSKVEWVSLGNFTDFPSGGCGAWGINPEYQPELVLNKNSKNAMWAAKLLNWMFDNNENYMLTLRGVEGSEWEYTNESKTEYNLLEGNSDRYLGLYQLNEWYDDTVYPVQYVSEENWRPFQQKKLQDKINTLDVIAPCDWFVPYDLTGTEAEFLVGDSDTTINEACAKVVTGEWGETEWNNAVKSAWESEGKIFSKVWTEQYHAFVD